MIEPILEFDATAFWGSARCDQDDYIDQPVTNEVRALVEKSLGYRLPDAYVALARIQNGGIPARYCHRTKTATSWAEDHIAINGIYSIGGNKPCSLLGEFNSDFWCSEWGYPDIGVYFADCPSAGHDMLCLDYRASGPNGEPRVVHVDQEFDFKITVVADSFEDFLRGLQDETVFE